MTSEEYRLNFHIPKRMKYRNVKTKIDNIVFDSKKEAQFYGKYKLLEKAGELTMQRQVRYDFIINDINCGFYKADFVLTWKSGNVQVVDVKGGIKTSTYQLKKRLMFAVNGIKIFEV